MSKINLFKKKEQKELTPQQQKVRTVLGWVASALCVVIIIIALVISIMTITRTTGEKGVANIAGNAFMPVQTDSMEPTFDKGDLIITKIYEGNGTDLQVGQVITYKARINNGGTLVEIFKTHRISKIEYSNGSISYIEVVGDNPNPQDGAAGKDYIYNPNNIVATWGSPATPIDSDGDGGYDSFNVTKDSMGKNMGKIGVFINWLQGNRTNYFLVIVLPLILMFVIYAYILIRSFILAKLAKTKEEAVASTATVDGLSEEDKRRLAEEYLAELARRQLEAEQATAPAEDATPAETNTDKEDEQA
ncbi:MAG: signal peptidase I [Clostridia bacterium]|nr:signal peptidase I [Clostridia bacterium]